MAQAEKAWTVGSAFAYGAALGGAKRVDEKLAQGLLYGGAIGGLLGAFALRGTPANVAEGIAATSVGIFGAGLTAPGGSSSSVDVGVTRRIVRGSRGRIDSQGFSPAPRGTIAEI